MIRRPNVRARCYRHGLYFAQDSKTYKRRRTYWACFRFCRWCRRRAVCILWTQYPGLCADCNQYLVTLECDHIIHIGEGPFNAAIWEQPPVYKILKIQDDEQPCVLCRMKPPLPGSDRCRSCLDLFGPE